MKLKKIMRTYYQNKLDQIETIQPKFKLTESPGKHFRFVFPQRWEDIFGIGVTVCYLLQFLLPGNWFSIGRCLSVFKIGF
jgi:hypothetical protein